MSRYDEYVCSNDTPKTLCKEIEALNEIIKNMRCCATCENLTIFTDDEPCNSCHNYEHYKLKERKTNEENKN